MIVIGEKINGAIPSVGAAIRERNAQVITDLAIAQTQAGSNYLDVCAGIEPELEYDALVWLLEVVQAASDLPICIDSPDPNILLRVLPLINKPGLINSVSGEGEKCALLFPFLEKNPAWRVIALTCDDNGIPADSESKAKIAFRLIEEASAYSIDPERIFIDPLVLSLSAVDDAMLQFMDAILLIKAIYPTVKFTSGLSNISYGMPLRGLVNRNFLVLALSAGMDSAIMDPLNKPLSENIFATEALLGTDKHGRKFNQAYRKGLIG